MIGHYGRRIERELCGLLRIGKFIIVAQAAYPWSGYARAIVVKLPAGSDAGDLALLYRPVAFHAIRRSLGF